MSIPMFHYVQQQMEKYYDMIKVEKKKFGVWVRRLHLALRAYKELLYTLLAMDKSTDPTVKESAKVLKSNIFYVLEYREFILNTFLNYDENKMPRSYLVDLVETVHLFLKMLEHYCKKTGLVVQKKIKKKSKSKRNKPRAQRAPPTEPGAPAWEEARPQLAAVLSAGPEEYPPPFDAASDVPIDQQKEDCMRNIQKSMREYKFENAVGMFRAAREVWPEDGIFGASDIAEDEELSMLETIYNTDLGVVTDVTEIDEVDETQGSEYEEEDEEERSTAIVETDFDFQDFVQRFCHPKVVSSCVSLLERYDKNLPHTNHCAIKMLHRVAWDCKRPSMMFQASLFLIFQKIFNHPMQQHKELEKFGIYIFRKFTEIASKNPKTFIELLFWTNSKDALDIEYGYDLYTDSRDKLGKGVWSEEQEEELRRLYMENQTNPETDQDVIDWILENLIDRTRTRRSVIKKLKELGLIFKAPTKRSNKERARERVPKEFSPEEDEMLRELWPQYADSADPMALIISRMPRKRQKKSYVERLLELGLVNDKNECRKKRQKNSEGKSTRSGDDKSNDDESSSSGSESESDTKRTSFPSKQTAPKPRKTKNQTKAKRVELNASQVAKLLVSAVDNGLSEALKWLAENLEELALDQEAEGYDPNSEGTPLVPITDESTEAMDNELFKQVLLGIGVVPPNDEQESYWRIPSCLHFETIRKRREIIIRAVQKELIIGPLNEDQTEKQLHEIVVDESSNDDDLFNNLRKLREINADTKKVIRTETANDITKPNYRKRGRTESNQENRRQKLTKIDEDYEHELTEDSEDVLSFAKRTLQQDTPDTEEILNNISKLTSDDSGDDEDIVPVKRNSKKRRIVIEDDSE